MLEVMYMPAGKGFKESISRMAYERPAMEKRILHMRKSWNEVSKRLNPDKKKK